MKLNRNVIGPVVGIMLGMLLIQFPEYNRIVIIVCAILFVPMTIWLLRKQRTVLSRMPKSTIEYLNHDGEN